jgi:hypothetical protein
MLSAPKVVYFSFQSVIPDASTAECGKEAELSEIPVIVTAALCHITHSLTRKSLYGYIVLFEKQLEQVVKKLCLFYGNS